MCVSKSTTLAPRSATAAGGIDGCSPPPAFTLAPALLPLAVALFQPLAHLLQVVKKRPFPTEVCDLPLLYDAHPFVGNAVGNVSVVVHAVCHQLTLRRQRKVFDKFPGCSESLFQALVLPDVKRAGAHGRGLPAVRRVSLVNVHKQEISHIAEVLHQLPEGRQVADERGSGGRAKVDNQRAIGRFKIQKMTLHSITETGSRPHVGHATDAAPAGSIWHLDQFGVWCLTAELHLRTQENRQLFPHKRV